EGIKPEDLATEPVRFENRREMCVEHQASALVNAALDDRARYLQHSLKQLDTGQVVRHPLAPEKEEGVIHVLGQVDGSQQLLPLPVVHTFSLAPIAVGQLSHARPDGGRRLMRVAGSSR